MNKQGHEVARLRDEDTGNLHVIAVRRPRTHNGEYALIFQEPLLHLLKVGKSLTRSELLVWTLLTARMTYPNVVESTITRLAEDVDRERSVVSKALKALQAREMVLRVGPGRFLVDPRLAFRGRAGQRDDALKDWHERWDRRRGAECDRSAGDDNPDSVLPDAC